MVAISQVAVIARLLFIQLRLSILRTFKSEDYMGC